MGIKDRAPLRSWANPGEERVKCPLCRAVVSHRVGAEHMFSTLNLFSCGRIELM